MPFSERKRLRNVVQSLKVRLKSRVQLLLYDKEIRRKDEVFDFMMDTLKDMMPSDKQMELSNRMNSFIKSNEAKYDCENLQITEEGLKFYGEVRPRNSCDPVTISIP